MTFIVDHLFPPIKFDEQEDSYDYFYTSFNYWRDPIGDLDLELSRSASPVNDLSKPLPTIAEA